MLSSMNSATSWGSQEQDWQSQLLNPPKPRTKKAASFADLVNGRCTIEDVMQEFRMNGSDSPYNPDDDQYWTRTAGMSPGLTPAPASAYLRQTSWPAPARSPAQRLPRPLSASYPLTAAPAPAQPSEVPELPGLPSQAAGALTAEQRRVVSSLPDAAVLTLLREMQRRARRQPDECRFCKNNGEREAYYRSHVLKEAGGRVACPVLRAFVCKRCGARGDNAHTLKYCPLSTGEERIKSSAMMRSLRLSSGRRRFPSPGDDAFVKFGDTPGAVLADGDAYARLATQPTWPTTPTQPTWPTPSSAPLDPLWAALEQKLML